MESVRKYIYKQVAEQTLSREEAKQMLMELQGKQEQTEDDIAVIGISGRFGGADNVKEYWQNLRNGVCSIGAFPRERRKDTDPLLRNPHLSMFFMGTTLPEGVNPEELDLYHKGGYIKEIDKFDAGFFNIPPREAKFISPVQRVFLETSWEAIEDGGYGGEKIANTNTGVFVGYDNTSLSLYKYVTASDPLHETGSYSSILASRISYLFNLRGPAVVIDTACSSAMVALHVAAQSLKKRECDMAIAGGIYILYTNVKSQSDMTTNLNKATSEEARIRTFDKKARGTVWSEGASAILIKPLKKAIQDRDNIYAVIRGSAINNDGFSNGITAPNAEAQEDVIVRAWKDARVEPETIGYIESHGTGTVIGDPIEIKGLTNAFRRFTDKRQFCGIGSVKPNIGHSVAASGLASILKVILALKHKEIPPSINFDEVNPFIDFSESPLFVNDRLTGWKEGCAPRVAGISAFGFSGTNCHIVLSEAPAIEKETPAVEPEFHVLAISGRDESAVAAALHRYYDYLRNRTREDIGDICFTANTGRGHYSNRIAIIAADCGQLEESIGGLLKYGWARPGQEGVFYGRHKIVVPDKKNREEYEITEKEKKQLTESVRKNVAALISSEWKDISQLHEICGLYIKGAGVDWDEMYRGQKRRRVSLPAYPFKRSRYWAELLVSPTGRIGNAAPANEPAVGPLLDRQLCDSIYQGIFHTEFSTDRQWVLKEHKVLGSCVVPGTAHLEMVLEACRRYYREEALEIANVVFLAPLVVYEAEAREVQLVLKKEKDCMEFVIAGRSGAANEDGEEQWTIHTEGKLYRMGRGQAPVVDMTELKNNCLESIDIGAHKKMKNFTFGPRWDNIALVHAGEKDDALLAMQLPEAYAPDLASYLLHPALLDNAVNGMAQHVRDSGKGGMYLPLSYKSIRIYGRLPGTFFSYARRIRRERDNTETKTYDIILAEPSGKVIADIKEYTVKRVHRAEQMLRAGYGYEIGWVEEAPEEALKEPRHSDDENGSILVFKDKAGIADRVIQNAGIPQNKIIMVETGKEYSKTEEGYTVLCCENDISRLLEEIKERKPVRIMHFSSMSENDCTENMEQLDESVRNGVLSLFYLAKALVNHKYNDSLNIALVSDCTKAVTGEEKNINPYGASVFGLAKVVSQEYPRLLCKCIDIDGDTPSESIIREIYSGNQAVEVALRGARRYVMEFREINTDSIRHAETEIKASGAYIITGGLGSIGLEVAGYLSAKNKANIVLINRSGFPERDKWEDCVREQPGSPIGEKIKTIKAIEESGSHVECMRCDISDYGETKIAIEAIKRSYGRINGVVHSAGVAGAGFIFTKDEDSFKKVLAPKIYGTWVMDHLTRNEEMDFFIMFSSISAVLGIAGQSDYVAGNSYMDAYAAYRRMNGKRTVSINWPAWTEIGMAANHDFGQEENGVFKSISADNAMFVFDRVLGADLTNIIPVELNYEAAASMMDQFPIRLSGKVKRDLLRRKEGSQKAAHRSKPVPADFKVEIKGLDSERPSEVKERLAKIWGRILEIREIDIYESFYSLGGDSMLAAQLMKELDAQYPGMVNIADIFSYPSIAQLGDYIEDAIGGKAVGAKVAAARDTEDDRALKEMLDKIEAGESSVEDGLDVLKKI